MPISKDQEPNVCFPIIMPSNTRNITIQDVRIYEFLTILFNTFILLPFDDVIPDFEQSLPEIVDSITFLYDNSANEGNTENAQDDFNDFSSHSTSRKCLDLNRNRE